MSVIVSSTSWSPGFLDAPSSTGLGSLGYTIPVGSSAQLQPLPWDNMNQIRIVFSENVNVQQNSLTLSGTSVNNYAFSSFSYNATTFTATWTLAAPLGADRLRLDLHATGAAAITDAHGKSLDGEWSDAVSTYPSGNGISGGDFLFDFNVLPGDIDGNGVVNGVDINLLVGNFKRVSGGLAGDLNGDGIVNGLDLNALASAWITMLPGGVSGTGSSVALAATVALARQQLSVVDDTAANALAAAQDLTATRTSARSILSSAGDHDDDMMHTLAVNRLTSLQHSRHRG